MQPLAWSPSRLSDFVNCPWSFKEKSVLKRYPFKDTKETLWGKEVHKIFEERLNGTRSVLPDNLIIHEPHMQKLEAFGQRGILYTERQIALDRNMEPCAYFSPRGKPDVVWFRGVIDVTIITGAAALIEDYKTGKKKPDFRQLKTNALWVFANYPQIHTVLTRYYWTTDQSLSAETYTRDQVPALWAELVPDLRQWAQAFKTDTWQKRPSGLCNGWCPVENCEFWKPRRK